MKTYKQRTEEILQKAENKRKLNKKIRISAIAASVCAAFVALSCVLFVPFKAEAPSVKQYQDSEYYSVIQQINQIKYKPPKYKNNYEKLADGLSNIFAPKYGAAAPGGSDMTAAPESGGAGSFVETTDNQTAGVSEADLLKRTDKYIFYLDVEGYCLYAYNIAQEQTEMVDSYQIKTPSTSFYFYNNMEMYLTEDASRILLVGSCMKYKENTKYTMVISLDVTDPTNLREVGRVYLSGDYVSSRLTDGSLFLVNNFSVRVKHDFNEESSYLPQFGAWGNMQSVAAEDIVCPENATSAKYAVVCEIDPYFTHVKDCKALLSYSSEIYASRENLFLTRSYSEKQNYYSSKAMTEISCLYYGGEGLEYKGAATVAGSVKNQYSMDEYGGMLRVVTTVNYPVSNASLYCISLSDFTILGSLENFAPDGDTVESVRFDGEKAYVCTAVVITLTDPVYAIDLSDLENITCVDTGVIEGYSTSLVNFTDGYLLGIGYGDSWNLKIEIYEETQTTVDIVATYEADVSFSEDYKSYLIDRENGFIGMGIQGYYVNSEYDNGYMLFLFDGYQIMEFAFIPIHGAQQYKRAVIIDGYIYVFSDYAYKVQALYGET